MLPFSTRGPSSKRQRTQFSASPLPTASRAETVPLCLAPNAGWRHTVRKQSACYGSPSTTASWVSRPSYCPGTGFVKRWSCLWHTDLRGSWASSWHCEGCSKQNWKFVEYLLHRVLQSYIDPVLSGRQLHLQHPLLKQKRGASGRRHHSLLPLQGLSRGV